MSNPNSKSRKKGGNKNRKPNTSASGKGSGAKASDETRREPLQMPKTVAGQIIDTVPEKKEEGDYKEDNLEMRSMSFKERRAIRKERREKEMEGMSRMQRVSYLLYYYKTPLIMITGGVVVVTLLVVSILMGKRPVVLSVGFINVPSEKTVVETDFDDYIEAIKLAYEGSIKLDTAAKLDKETAQQTYNNNPYDYSLTQFPVLCSSDFFDVLITDRTGLDFCSDANMILDPETIISPDTILALRDHQVDAKDSTGESYFYGYDISDTAFAKKLNFGTKLYICFPGSQDTNKQNAERFLKYLYGLPIEAQ